MMINRGFHDGGGDDNNNVQWCCYGVWEKEGMREKEGEIERIWPKYDMRKKARATLII